MIEYRDIKRLKYNARDLALMMSDSDIDTVIAEFVEVKTLRDHYRNEQPPLK
jgi:hypothetical protein